MRIRLLSGATNVAAEGLRRAKVPAPTATTGNSPSLSASAPRYLGSLCNRKGDRSL